MRRSKENLAKFRIYVLESLFSDSLLGYKTIHQLIDYKHPNHGNYRTYLIKFTVIIGENYESCFDL